MFVSERVFVVVKQVLWLTRHRRRLDSDETLKKRRGRRRRVKELSDPLLVR